jgi:aspartate/methionine/tyrosine aminotransferase
MTEIQSPIIPIVAAWIRDSPGTISLGQGVVNYGPPSEALAAIAPAFADPNNHRYQHVQGILPLRQAIATKLAVENGINAELDQIVVTAGSNMGFVNAILAITQPGDEVILFRPYYFNHEMAIRMAGCTPVFVDTDANYQIQLDQLQVAITAKTRALVTISPNNPTGVVYPAELLTQINQLCQQAKIFHISDEAYEYFTYEGAQHFSPGALVGGEPYTISLFSLSKAYGFASWRIGYMVIPAQLQLALQKIQDTILICPPVACQYAALAALQVGKGYCQAHLVTIAETQQRFLNALAPLSEFCHIPAARGAFYFFLHVQTPEPALSLAKKLI